MSRHEELVKTEFGEAKIPVFKCDMCGEHTVPPNTWGMKAGWMQLRRAGKDAQGGMNENSREELDFCSVDCTVRFLVPDIYSTDPIAVTNAIANLRSIEESLGNGS